MTKQRIERVSGSGLVVRGDDIDTDEIIPARFMKGVTFEGLEDHAFEDVRRDSEGQLKGHPMDDPRFSGASILVVNRNFGCGSSREHAPQALRRWGIQAIVAESFAEIFLGNCVALGLPPVNAPHEDVARIMDSVELDPTQEISIDLEARTLTYRGGTLEIGIADGPRAQLLDGSWDALQTLLAAEEAIHATAGRLPYLRDF